MHGGFNTTQMKVAINLAKATEQEFIYLVAKDKGGLYRIAVADGINLSYGKKSGYATINLSNITACKLNDPVKQDDGNYDGTVANCASVNIKNYNIEVPGTNNATVTVNEGATAENISDAVAMVKDDLINSGFSRAEANQVTPVMALSLIDQVEIVPNTPATPVASDAFYEMLRNNCKGIDGAKDEAYNMKRLKFCFHPDKNKAQDAAAIFQRIMNERGLVGKLFLGINSSGNKDKIPLEETGAAASSGVAQLQINDVAIALSNIPTAGDGLPSKKEVATAATEVLNSNCEDKGICVPKQEVEAAVSDIYGILGLNGVPVLNIDVKYTLGAIAALLVSALVSKAGLPNPHFGGRRTSKRSRPRRRRTGKKSNK
jgi:hypothetical protein